MIWNLLPGVDFQRWLGQWRRAVGGERHRGTPHRRGERRAASSVRLELWRMEDRESFNDISIANLALTAGGGAALGFLLHQALTAPATPAPLLDVQVQTDVPAAGGRHDEPTLMLGATSEYPTVTFAGWPMGTAVGNDGLSADLDAFFAGAERTGARPPAAGGDAGSAGDGSGVNGAAARGSGESPATAAGDGKTSDPFAGGNAPATPATPTSATPTASPAAASVADADNNTALLDRGVPANSLRFEQNVGQVDARQDFVVQVQDYALWLDSTGVTLVAPHESASDPRAQLASLMAGGDTAPVESFQTVVQMHFAGGNADALALGHNQLPGTGTLFVSAAGQASVSKSFAQVEYQELYPGVSVVYRTSPEGLVEWDAIVAPGADPGAIRQVFVGATNVALDTSGNLVIDTERGSVFQSAPVLYQESNGVRHTVSGHYAVNADQSVQVVVGTYDTSRPLIIDPVIGFGGALPSLGVTEYAVPTSNSKPIDIAHGPDGNLWFVEEAASKVTRIDAAGAMTEYALPAGSDPVDIWAGPDGNLWFTEFNPSRIGKITPTGQVTIFNLAAGRGPNGITAGPDGNIWFTETWAHKIGRITPSGTVTEFALPSGALHPIDIALGADGNLWFPLFSSNQIGRITPTGQVTLFAVPTAGAQPAGIAAAPDGALWFTEYGKNKIGRITTAGVVTEYTIPTSNSVPYAINVGPDGNLWFAESAANKIGRLTLAGQFQEYTGLTAGSQPTGIVGGFDNSVWFTEFAGNRIGKLSLDLPQVQVTANPSETFEQEAVAGAFTFTRTGDTSAPLTVSYTVAGTATSGADYTPLPGSLTFAAGEASVTVPLTPLADGIPEPVETVVVALTTMPGYMLGAATSATVTIADSQVPSSIVGRKFHDRDGDSVQDPGEEARANETVDLLNSSGQVIGTTQTASDGSYTFTDLTPGLYTVQPLPEDGWTPTTSGSVLVGSGGSYTADLGSFHNIRISGYKFEDVSRDGHWQSGEPELAGWTIELYTIDADGSLSDAPLQATLTDVNGEYQFTDLGPLPTGSSYVVVEVQQPGWVQTAPADNAANTIELPSGLRGYVIPAVSGIAITTGAGQRISISGSGTVRLNALNNSTTATVSYNDQAGNSGSISTFLSQFNVTFTGGPGTPVSFDTFCIDLLHRVSVGQTYQVEARDDLDPAFANGNRMAYIFQRYGMEDLRSDPIQAAAVQLALWNLSLDNHNPTSFARDADGSYSSGDESVFQVTFGGNPNADAIAALTHQYLVESIAATAPGSWLDASLAGMALNRGQSLLLPEVRYDFGNRRNRRPSPVKQSVVTTEETPLTITLQATDPDNDPLTYSLFREPQHGTVTLVGNVATYTPDPGFLGADEFTFQANDGLLNSNLGVVRVAVLEAPPSEEEPEEEFFGFLPPEAFAGPAQQVMVGAAAIFQGEADDPEGMEDIVAIEWDMDFDGVTFDVDSSGSLTPSHTYAEPGFYFVALQVTDSGGNTAFDVTSVAVLEADTLLVNAGADVEVTVGAPVAFNGSYTAPEGATVAPEEIAWDFDYDGETFSADITGTLTPTYTFPDAGAYQVALQVTDDQGNSEISVLFAFAEFGFAGPTANAGSDRTVNEGATITFNGSFTPGDGAVDIGNVAWDFDYDGETFLPYEIATLTPTYQFTDAGIYKVALEVTDDNGESSLSVLTVTVNNLPPTITLGPDQTIDVGDTLSFTATFSDADDTAAESFISWDFNYDGQVFEPSLVTGLNATHTFIGPGVYTLAVQAIDGDGASQIATMRVTVNDTVELVADAGPSLEVAEGDPVEFDARYIVLSDPADQATVSVSTAQWDFDYDGSQFDVDAAAVGTLAPSHTYDRTGTYLVGVRLTDSESRTQVGTLYVNVFNLSPDVDAGPDQTIHEGQTTSFTATVSDAGGPDDIVTVEWDFEYDGLAFVPSASGLTGSHQYLSAGDYDVAVRATDRDGASSLSFLTVHVLNVAPTAVVTTSGPAPEGSPVTFTVSAISDPDPTGVFSYWADWDGSGLFEQVPPDELQSQPDGSVTFSHIYDDNGTYPAVVRIVDMEGGETDYTLSVEVTNVAPTADFLTASGTGVLQEGQSVFFDNITDPSETDVSEGFSYFFSVDGGSCTNIGSAEFFLPEYVPGASHTVSGYVQDKDGGISPVHSTTVTVYANVSFQNHSTGSIRVNWDGAAAPVELSPNGTYEFGGAVEGLTVTLLTSGAVYDLRVNGDIEAIDTDPGVSSVRLTVHTDLNDGMPSFVGAGNIGTIALPGGGSVLSVYARGDLGNITGPAGSGLTGLEAMDLFFSDLEGSITGLDHIDILHARGWLGHDSAQQVTVADGIDYLMAYGIGATVQSNVVDDTSSSGTEAIVGVGGVSGTLDLDDGAVLQMADAAGNIVAYTDPLGNQTTFTYDAGGNPLTLTDTFGLTVSRSYDAQGRLLSETNRNGLRRDMTWSDDGLLVSEVWYGTDGVTVIDSQAFTYDAAGNLLTATNSVGTYTMTYGENGELLTQTDPHGLTLTFSYDAVGNAVTVHDSLGGSIDSTYDVENRLTSRQLNNAVGMVWRVEMTYTLEGYLATQTRFTSAGQVGSSTYTWSGGRLAALQHRDGSDALLADYTYDYNDRGWLLAETRDGVTVNYAYDNAGQLLSDGATTYSYDANGNRNLPGYVVGPDNRLLSDGTWNYSYDLEGNLDRRTHIVSGETWQYRYDNANRLSAVDQRASDSTLLQHVDYEYDAFGMRTGQSVWTADSGTTVFTQFAYIGQEVWADLDEAGALQTRYLRGDYTDELLARVDGTGAVGYLTDRLGSVRDLIDGSGAAFGRFDFDGYGNLSSGSPLALLGRYGWTGREVDAPTGFYHGIRGRNYNPAVGRWNSPDPIGFHANDSNLYRYVRNSPLNQTDPSGNCEWYQLGCLAEEAGDAVVSGARSVGQGIQNGVTYVGNAVQELFQTLLPVRPTASCGPWYAGSRVMHPGGRGHGTAGGTRSG